MPSRAAPHSRGGHCLREDAQADSVILIIWEAQDETPFAYRQYDGAGREGVGISQVFRWHHKTLA